MKEFTMEQSTDFSKSLSNSMNYEAEYESKFRYSQNQENQEGNINLFESPMLQQSLQFCIQQESNNQFISQNAQQGAMGLKEQRKTQQELQCNFDDLQKDQKNKKKKKQEHKKQTKRTTRQLKRNVLQNTKTLLKQFFKQKGDMSFKDKQKDIIELFYSNPSIHNYNVLFNTDGLIRKLLAEFFYDRNYWKRIICSRIRKSSEKTEVKSIGNVIRKAFLSKNFSGMKTQLP